MRSLVPSIILGVSLLISLPLTVAAEEAEGVSGDSEAASLLEEAISAYDDLRIQNCLDTLGRAERAGELSEEQQVRLSLYRGLALSSLGRSGEADQSFRRALELDHSIALPPQTSPVVVERFETLRGEVSTPADPVDPVDPVNPIDPVDPVDPIEPVVPVQPFQRRLLTTWIFLGLTGATFLGGGTSLVLSLVTRAQARDEARSQDEANDLLDTYRLETRLAVGLLAASAALGVATLVAYFGERPNAEADESTSRRRGRSIALVPTINGFLLSGTL